jgi:hypothetical protein
MKQSTLEPGLLYVLRVYVVLGRFLTPSVPILLFLVVYLFLPWWRRRMGHLFLPMALILLAAQGILANYLTLHWSVPLSTREPAAFSLMLPTWCQRRCCG